MFVRLHVRGLRLSVCLNTILMVEAQLQGVGWHEHLLGVVLGVREIFLSRESSKYVAFEQQFDPHSVHQNTVSRSLVMKRKPQPVRVCGFFFVSPCPLASGGNIEGSFYFRRRRCPHAAD